MDLWSRGCRIYSIVKLRKYIHNISIIGENISVTYFHFYFLPPFSNWIFIWMNLSEYILWPNSKRKKEEISENPQTILLIPRLWKEYNLYFLQPPYQKNKNTSKNFFRPRLRLGLGCFRLLNGVVEIFYDLSNWNW